MTAVEDVFFRLDQLQAALGASLRRGALDRQGANLAVSEAEANLGSLRQIRLDLDTSDTLAWISDPTDPVQILSLELFVRQSRARLVRLAGVLHTLRDQAEMFVGGDQNIAVIATDDDTLQALAQKHLGNWRRYPELLDANPSVPVDDFGEGLEVLVPKSAPGVSASRTRRTR